MHSPPSADLDALRVAIAEHWATHARDLPWREDSTSAWGVLVSETMSQQTPVARVAPSWTAWMERWPTPADLADAPTADVLRAWGSLGYPRRALRLQECAAAIVERHGGAVPQEEDELLALPGVGPYTAAAVRAFAYRRRAVVLDTNVRRLLARTVGGRAAPPPGAPNRAERELAEALLPDGDEASAEWNIGLMEFGALMCTARSPRCEVCPASGACAWRRAGHPADEHAARRRTQTYEGTDRQARGRVMARLREAADGTLHSWAELVSVASTDPDQAQRAVATLLADGLVVERAGELRLP